MVDDERSSLDDQERAEIDTSVGLGAEDEVGIGRNRHNPFGSRLNAEEERNKPRSAPAGRVAQQRWIYRQESDALGRLGAYRIRINLRKERTRSLAKT
jgi:hypothetical protein